MSIVHFSRCQLLTLPLAALLLAGCTKWSSVGDPVDQHVRDQNPWQVRLTLTDGDVAYLWDPEIVGDSIAGFTRQPSKDPDQRERQPRAAYPLDRVVQLERYSASTLGTFLFIGGFAAMTAGIIAMAGSWPAD